MKHKLTHRPLRLWPVLLLLVLLGGCVPLPSATPPVPPPTFTVTPVPATAAPPTTPTPGRA